MPSAGSVPSTWEGTRESHLPTVEVITQGDSRTFRLEEQVKATSKGARPLSEHGLRHRRRSPQIDIAADETISSAVTGALASA